MGKLPNIFSLMKINALNNVIQVDITRYLDKLENLTSAELVYKLDFSAVFSLWILFLCCFVVMVCGQSTVVVKTCMPAQITILFRANKAFYIH